MVDTQPVMMKVDDELRGICQAILSENKSEDEWAEVESGDWFQTAKYCGGYDADDREFTFSVKLAAGVFCFGFPLCLAKNIACGTCAEIPVEPSPWG